MTNRVKELRESLGFTQTQAGQILLGNENKKSAYDQWSQIEKGRKVSKPTEKLLSIILVLIEAKEFKTKNCHGALDLVLKMIEPIDGRE